MSTTAFKSGKLTFDLSLGTAAKPAPRDPDAPLHVLVVGDFGGHSQQTEGGGKPAGVDCDNFAEIMAALQPRCRLTLGGQPAELSLASLDDFHPDRLLSAIEPLLGKEAAPSALAETNEDLIGRLMGDPPPTASPVAKPKVDIASLLKTAVGSSAVASNPAADAARAASDLSRTTSLRAVLHDGNLQRLEANWRGLEMLVRNFGGEEEVCLSVLDCNFGRLVAELTSQDDLQSTPLWQLLRRRSPDERFALVVGLYTFEPRPAHMDVLARAAKICAAQEATFISAASSEFAGCKSFSAGLEYSALPGDTGQMWDTIRAIPEARRLALALPRFLLRQPYGASSDPIEAFAFEELTPQLAHEDFLWGNPAILCAYALIEAFLAEGWQASTSGFAEIGELPVYRFKENSEVKPCAETWMPERVAEKISALGLIPILSIKGRDAVRIDGLRSVSAADPALLF
jgi:type VI secretion system ImpC/EvpB family protein